MGNAFGGDHPLPKEIQLLCFCLVGENWIFPLINYENILYVCDCMCVCAFSIYHVIHLSKSRFLHMFDAPPKFSKSNEEYQDSPLNNCFLKGSQHQPIRTVHGRALVQAAWPDSGCGDLWKNLLVDRLINVDHHISNGQWFSDAPMYYVPTIGKNDSNRFF